MTAWYGVEWTVLGVEEVALMPPCRLRSTVEKALDARLAHGSLGWRAPRDGPYYAPAYQTLDSLPIDLDEREAEPVHQRRLLQDTVRGRYAEVEVYMRRVGSGLRIFLCPPRANGGVVGVDVAPSVSGGISRLPLMGETFAISLRSLLAMDWFLTHAAGMAPMARPGAAMYVSMRFTEFATVFGLCREGDHRLLVAPVAESERRALSCLTGPQVAQAWPRILDIQVQLASAPADGVLPRLAVDPGPISDPAVGIDLPAAADLAVMYQDLGSPIRGGVWHRAVEALGSRRVQGIGDAMRRSVEAASARVRPHAAPAHRARRSSTVYHEVCPRLPSQYALMARDAFLPWDDEEYEGSVPRTVQVGPYLSISSDGVTTEVAWLLDQETLAAHHHTMVWETLLQLVEGVDDIDDIDENGRYAVFSMAEETVSRPARVEEVIAPLTYGQVAYLAAGWMIGNTLATVQVWPLADPEVPDPVRAQLADAAPSRRRITMRARE